jgi:hypothetical protein
MISSAPSEDKQYVLLNCHCTSRSKIISRGVADRKPSEWKQCLHAARWIPRAYDMYCTLDEVIRVCRILEQGEALDSDDEDNEESKVIKTAYNKILSNL